MNPGLQNSLSGSRLSSQSQHQLPLKKIFRIPLALALTSGLGLVSALVGDGAFDWLSWAALGIPVAVIFKYGRGT